MTTSASRQLSVTTLLRHAAAFDAWIARRREARAAYDELYRDDCSRGPRHGTRSMRLRAQREQAAAVRDALGVTVMGSR